MKNILLISLLGGWLVNNLNAQIYFDNPSFEGNEQFGTPPPLWMTCERTPDTRHRGDYYIDNPSDGNSFLGLISGINWRESVGQYLSGLHTANNPVHFYIDAARDYDTNPSNALLRRFQVYLGNNLCDTTKLIYTSPTLDTIWKRYTININVPTDYNNISFSVTNEGLDYQIGLDNLSPIYEGIDSILIQEITNPLGSDNSHSLKTITISPNPSTGLYYINQSSDAPLLVYDINGQLLQHYAPHTAQIDLSHLAAGLYILSIGTDKQRLVKL